MHRPGTVDDTSLASDDVILSSSHAIITNPCTQTMFVQLWLGSRHYSSLVTVTSKVVYKCPRILCISLDLIPTWGHPSSLSLSCWGSQSPWDTFHGYGTTSLNSRIRCGEIDVHILSRIRQGSIPDTDGLSSESSTMSEDEHQQNLADAVVLWLPCDAVAVV